jgi:Flp pilus assembly protein TadG
MRPAKARPAKPRRPTSRGRRDPQNGGAVVEFAIVLPLFLAILFSVIDFGWYFYQKFTLAAAVQTGIRASLSVKETDRPDPWITAREAAKTALSNAGAIAPASVTWGPTDVPSGQQYGDPSDYNGSAPNRAVILTGQYTFIPLVGFVKLPNKTMTYSITMVLDAQNAKI